MTGSVARAVRTAASNASSRPESRITSAALQAISAPPPHRNRHLRRGKPCRVIKTVAHHCYDRTAALQLPDVFDLVTRCRFRVDPRDSPLPRNMPSDGGPVARQQMHLLARLHQFAHYAARMRPQQIGKREESDPSRGRRRAQSPRCRPRFLQVPMATPDDAIRLRTTASPASCACRRRPPRRRYRQRFSIHCNGTARTTPWQQQW